jgi:hypothetical protein
MAFAHFAAGIATAVQMEDLQMVAGALQSAAYGFSRLSR